jgi:predicted PurR-regulated permease PerM
MGEGTMDSQGAPRREIVFTRGVKVAAVVFAILMVLYQLRSVFTPLFLAFAMAYVLDPVVDRLESWRIPRALGVVVVVLLFVTAATLMVVLVIPGLVTDVANVIRELPGHASAALASVEPWLARYNVRVPHTTNEWLEQLQGKANMASGTLVSSAGDALRWFVGGTVSALGAIAAALIVPVFAIYLLYDFDRIAAATRDLTPLRYRANVVRYAHEIDHVLGQFLRGQLIIMAVLAVLYGGAYSALGVRLAIPIGIIAGILNFIPYLGSAFALVAGLAMSLVGGGGWSQLIGVVIAYTVVQSLEGFVITPRVVGKTVGLRDVWVLLALFIGGEVFGFMGVLLALPLAAVAKVFITHGVDRYRASALFLTPPVAQPAAAPIAVDLPPNSPADGGRTE